MAQASDYYENMPVDPGTAKEIRVFEMTDFVVKQWKRAFGAVKQYEKKRDFEIKLRNLISGIGFYLFMFLMISVNLFRLAQGRMQVGVLLISSVLANLQKDEEYRYKTKWMTEGALVIHQFHDCCAQKSLNEVRFLGLFDFLKGKWRHSEVRTEGFVEFVVILH